MRLGGQGRFHERVHPRQVPWPRFRWMRSGSAGFHSHSSSLLPGRVQVGVRPGGAAISITNSRVQGDVAVAHPGGEPFLAGTRPRRVRLSESHSQIADGQITVASSLFLSGW